MKALGAYSTLTAEQKRLLHAKRLEGRHDVRELITLLEPLAAFDASAGSLRKWLVSLAILAAVLALVTRIAGVAAWVALLLLAAGVGCLVFYFRLRSVDLSDNLWKVALPFLAVLREDMPPGGVVDVKLDLTRATAKPKYANESAPYQRGLYDKIVDRFFLDPWFKGRAELADRSRLHWKVEDRVVVSKRRKRTGRKTKWKTKYRKRSSLHVEVALPDKAYDVAAEARDAPGGELMAKAGDKRTTLKVTRVVKQPSLDPIDVGALIDLVGQAYRRASPARKGGTA